MTKLGDTDLDVSPLCLGGNVFGWTADEDASFAVLDAYVAGGGTFIDTADSYSVWIPGHRGGESEEIIGRWMAARGNRDDVVIATKVGQLPGLEGLAPATIRRAVEDSLRRLQTDRIDLYWAHVDDADTPLAETLAAFGDLIVEGKVRAVGASNYTAPRLADALAIAQDEGLPRYARRSRTASRPSRTARAWRPSRTSASPAASSPASTAATAHPWTAPGPPAPSRTWTTAAPGCSTRSTTSRPLTRPRSPPLRSRGWPPSPRSSPPSPARATPPNWPTCCPSTRCG
jgi:hypothetical protein